MNGTPRQTFAKMTLQRAFHASPRKLMLPSIHPSCRSDQEMTENCGSKIHQKAMAESTVGTMKGIRITARMIALNGIDRKSTRLNSSHSQISYAVFCLKKKKN